MISSAPLHDTYCNLTLSLSLLVEEAKCMNGRADGECSLGLIEGLQLIIGAHLCGPVLSKSMHTSCWLTTAVALYKLVAFLGLHIDALVNAPEEQSSCASTLQLCNTEVGIVWTQGTTPLQLHMLVGS